MGKLNQLTASYEENYFTLTEQTERAIESARKELEEFADLGIDETTSLDAFQSAFESFVNSDAFTPEGYSQWLLAADALADLNNVVDDIDSSGTFESITDFVKDLMGLAADGTETLAAATAQYQETLALAQTGDADALAALTTDAQAYLDAVERSASTGTDVIIARSQVASDLSGTVYQLSRRVDRTQVACVLLVKMAQRLKQRGQVEYLVILTLRRCLIIQKQQKRYQ